MTERTQEAGIAPSLALIWSARLIIVRVVKTLPIVVILFLIIEYIVNWSNLYYFTDRSAEKYQTQLMPIAST